MTEELRKAMFGPEPECVPRFFWVAAAIGVLVLAANQGLQFGMTLVWMLR